jgi:hypothetical protein
MDTRDLPMLFAAAIVMFVMFGMCLVGWAQHKKYMQANAVKANVAYWTVDEKGAAKFHWITE